MVNPFPVSFYAFSEGLSALERRIDGQPALTDAGLIDALLAFANATAAELAHFTNAAVAAAAHVDATLSAVSGNPQTTMADHTRQLAPIVHGWVRDELSKIATGRGAFTRLDSGRPKVTEDSVVPGPLVVERLTGLGRAGRIERRYAFATLENYAQWSVLLARRLGVDICRCRLATCRKYFIAESTKGRIRRTYCTPAHMEAAQKLTASDRVMASRLGIPVSEFRQQRNRK
jgi:hypothetical protein